MLKSTLGQVKLSIEVQYITVTQFSGFLEGLFSDSATVRGAGGARGARGAWGFLKRGKAARRCTRFIKKKTQEK